MKNDICWYTIHPALHLFRHATVSFQNTGNSVFPPQNSSRNIHNNNMEKQVGVGFFFKCKKKIASIHSLKCIVFPPKIFERFLQPYWSPPLVISLDWTWFGKAHTSISSHRWWFMLEHKPSMKSKELSVDHQDRIVSKHKSGKGYRRKKYKSASWSWDDFSPLGPPERVWIEDNVKTSFFSTLSFSGILCRNLRGENNWFNFGMRLLHKKMWKKWNAVTLFQARCLLSFNLLQEAPLGGASVNCTVKR